jgi:hypothetical protein
MNKPKVAGGAPAAARDDRAKALRARMEDAAPLYRTKPMLSALQSFWDEMIEADELYDSDKAEAVRQAAHAAMELCHQLGIGRATRPLVGLALALEDRSRGRKTDWLMPKEELPEEERLPANRKGTEERYAIEVVVATVQALCDNGESVDGACARVARVIDRDAMAVSNWRHRIDTHRVSRESFERACSVARAGGPEVALDRLKRYKSMLGG